MIVTVLIYLTIGLVMGLFGGMLGIGGALVMVPALVWAFGENQHLYQASAMICTFFVALAASAVHRKAKILFPSVLRWLLPAGLGGVLIGVAVSNLPYFDGKNSYLLARYFGAFLLYVAGYSIWGLFRPPQETFAAENGNNGAAPTDIALDGRQKTYCTGIGLVTGFASGFLGIGAGTVVTPLLQMALGFSIKRAMSHSAALILGISWLGALHKNATLAGHQIDWHQSLWMALWISPPAIVGGFLGGRLLHILPRVWVQAVFILVVLASAYKLLTVVPTGG